MTKRTKLIYKTKVISLSDLFKLIKEEFKNHVGQENGVNLKYLLDKFFPENDEWTEWKQYTYMDIIRKAVGTVRRKQGIFIINKQGNMFVLKTQEEADYYKEILRKDIIGMKASIHRADRWIREEQWREYVGQ